jgi:hypothetical protein
VAEHIETTRSFAIPARNWKIQNFQNLKIELSKTNERLLCWLELARGKMTISQETLDKQLRNLIKVVEKQDRHERAAQKPWTCSSKRDSSS